MTLRLYSFFHLNLAFSSIEDDQRTTVINRCYWPLLQMLRRLRLPSGIELSGYTLEVINHIDSRWLAELRSLIDDGICELIGSGYSQLIGPLVPAQVNGANLHWGNSVYHHLLGLRPEVVLANEQAYSAGLVSNYLKYGYKALIMEWNNPSYAHPEWKRSWRFLPQRAVGTDNKHIALIWNDSIAFQKFQRYAHGEMDLVKYLSYVRSQLGAEDIAFPVYGNDVEVFNFRPGRFRTESQINAEGEWERIESLFEVLLQEQGMMFVRPSEVLELSDRNDANNKLRLESSAQPVPVKKQSKYNILRWAVTGRDDIDINTRCWRLYDSLRQAPQDDPRWKELCYLWSSDIRTHITASRWKQYQERLSRAEREWDSAVSSRWTRNAIISHSKRARETGDRLIIKCDGLRAILNKRRGLAIELLEFSRAWPSPICGTVPHGTYDDMQYSADWYTGNVVFELPAQHKVTDLEPATDVMWGEDPDGNLVVTGVVQTALGPVKKALTFTDADSQQVVGLDYEIDWPSRTTGSLRLGFITLLPGQFDAPTLFYRTHNGGLEPETFALHGTSVDHGSSVSALVSASHALGMTEGMLELGDAQKSILIEVDKTTTALVGMVRHQVVAGKTFCQMCLSVSEIDDTRKPATGSQSPLRVRIRLSAKN